MEKSSKWKRRVLLIALSGVIGMTIPGCKAKEKAALEQEDTENNLSNYIVVNANNDTIETTEIREISYLLEGKYYQMLGYLEKETPTEKIYRSITTPENSMIVKTNKEGKTIQYILQLNGNIRGQERIELQEILGDIPVTISKYFSYEQALNFETLSFISYNYQNFTKDHEKVAALVYKIENDYQMRLIEYVGKLDNKILFQSKSSKDTIWVLGIQNEKKEIVKYQIVGKIEGKAEFVSMDNLPEGLKFTEEEAEKIEADYESKKEINDNFNLIENSNEEWKTYKSLAKINYSVQGTDESFVLMAGLEKVEKNRNLYRCITIPEIYLEETFEPDNYMTNYRLIPVEGIQEDFTKKTKVTNVTFKLVGKSIYTFDEILLMEEEAQKELNEELNSGLGR